MYLCVRPSSPTSTWPSRPPGWRGPSSKNNSLYNVTDNNYYTKKNFNTSNITNNITRHNHNNYEHNVIEKVHKHINEAKQRSII